MVRCAVIGCKMRSDRDRGVRFFSIPSTFRKGPPYAIQRLARRRALWLQRLNITEEDFKRYFRVCSLHFTTGAPSPTSDETNPDWAPSLLMDPEGPMNADAEVPHLHQQDSEEEAAFSETNFEYVAVKPEPATSDTESAHELTFDTIDITNQDSNQHLLVVKCEENVLDTVISIDESHLKLEESDSKIEPTTDLVNTKESASSEPVLISACEAIIIDAELRSLRKEHADLKKAYTNLRNQLTETEVDKFELSNSLAQVTEACEKYKKENEEKDGRIEVLEEQLSSCRTKYVVEQRLEKIARCSISRVQLRNDNFMKFYTGLPSYSVFEILLDYLSDHVTEQRNVCLTRWQSCLLTLMRLRLSCSLQDLAFRFGVSISTAARTFERWLHYLYECLSPTIDWPSREKLLSTMPSHFKAAFGQNIAVIIDCFEVLIDKPTTPDSGAIDRQPNAVKFLIGFTPCGSLSFVSEAWIERVGDMQLTLNSGVLKSLLPNDAVLADGGITIGDDVILNCARVLMSAEGQAQLTSYDVDVYIKGTLKPNVEKMTGLLRKQYSILKSTLPANSLNIVPGHNRNQIEEIVSVCCALMNLSEKLI